MNLYDTTLEIIKSIDQRNSWANGPSGDYPSMETHSKGRNEKQWKNWIKYIQAILGVFGQEVKQDVLFAAIEDDNLVIKFKKNDRYSTTVSTRSIPLFIIKSLYPTQEAQIYYVAYSLKQAQKKKKETDALAEKLGNDVRSLTRQLDAITGQQGPSIECQQALIANK